jgi:predicted ATPase
VIESIRVQGFKSVEDAEIRFAPLTLVIGTNASGKSNLLEAVQLLGWVAGGQRLGELQHFVRQGALPLRGSVSDLGPMGEVDATIEFDVYFVGEPELGRLQLHLGLGIDGGTAHLRREVLRAPDLERTGLPLYYTAGASATHGHDVSVVYNNFQRGGRKPTVTCVGDRPIFAQLVSPARFDKRHALSQKRIPAAAEFVRRDLQGIVFLDPSPRAMRGYAGREETRLQGSGSNLSAVLWNLVQVPALRRQLLELIAEVPDHEIVDVAFIETPRNEVMLTLRESVGGATREVAAALLSDGTLRILAIAAALLSVPSGSVVVIEEIDNGVHPSRAKHLLRAIDRMAQERGLQVLITTHNPALQDDIPAKALADVLVVYRDRDSGCTVTRRLGDLEAYPEVVLRGPLGSLVTRRTLDRFLPGHRGEVLPPPLDLGFLADGD